MTHIPGFRILTLAGVLSLLALTACNNKNTSTNVSAGPAPAAAAGTGSRIAYVNVDTLEENYIYWKNKKQEMMAEQASIEAELQRSARQLQNDYAAVQQKARAGSLSESEGQAAEQRLGQMQQALETRRNTLSEQLQKKQIDFSTELQKNIDNFLEEYNKDNKYDYILSYSKSGSILFANKALDITADVLKGLNAANPAKDTSAKAK